MYSMVSYSFYAHRIRFVEVLISSVRSFRRSRDPALFVASSLFLSVVLTYERKTDRRYEKGCICSSLYTDRVRHDRFKQSEIRKKDERSERSG